LGVVITFVAASIVEGDPYKVAVIGGQSFWGLVNFTMQMAMVIIGGYVVATSPAMIKVIRALARVPKTPRGAVAYVAFLAMTSSLISWGLSLIFTGLLVREICHRLKGIDYRAISSAAYLGLGSVWAFGLSSSAAMLQATPSAIPKELLPITGVIPLTQTIFLWQSLLMAAILTAVSVAIAYFSCPSPEDARTQEDLGIEYRPLEVTVPARTRPGEWLEYAPVLCILVVLLGVPVVIEAIKAKGVLEALNLDTFNFLFLMVGLLLHGSPRSFTQAVAASVPATAGVLIQFPFYAFIFGMISKTQLTHVLGNLFAAISTKHTFPLLVAAYSALLGVFVPSGGGKWVIEAPYVMQAASAHEINLGWTVQIYNAAEALPNLLNPFWMLPLMGILSVRARELAGYSILQLLFHVPLVFGLCWALTYTLPYVPPQMTP
jgi:short-chain fatty acids transporter